MRYLLAVVQEGNITNAAKRLHVTQPTLSRQLANLEKKLGRQLYTRGHAGIAPTYSLGMNAKWLIRAGFGVAFTYDEILVTDNASDLAFIPLDPRIESRHGLVWRKTLPTRQAQVFLDALRSEIAPR